MRKSLNFAVKNVLGRDHIQKKHDSKFAFEGFFMAKYW